MEITQKYVGCYWTTNDPATLWLNEAGPDKPRTIRCYQMRDHLNRGEYMDAEIENMEFLAAGLFGTPRNTVDGIGGWTGDAYKYGVYLYHGGYRDSIVMLERHGGGMYGYHLDGTAGTAIELWKHLAANCTPEILWNLCHSMAEAYTTAREAEAHKWRKAIAQKQVKTSRRGGRVYVTITQPMVQEVA